MAASYLAAYQRSAYPTSAYGLTLFGLNVGWLVVLAALSAGSLLLYEAVPGNRAGFYGVQLAAGLVIIALGFRFLGIYPGVIMALAGGAALVAGAVVRYKP
jgi:hypothetical protein